MFRLSDPTHRAEGGRNVQVIQAKPSTRYVNGCLSWEQTGSGMDQLHDLDVQDALALRHHTSQM